MLAVYVVVSLNKQEALQGTKTHSPLLVSVNAIDKDVAVDNCYKPCTLLIACSFLLGNFDRII